MNKNSIIVTLYALLVLGGGVMGYLSANSIPSLIASVLFSSLLAFYAYMWNEGKVHAKYAIFGLLGILLVFFGIRYGQTGKFMTGGLMSITTSLILGYLLWDCGCFCCSCSKKDKEIK